MAYPARRARWRSLHGWSPDKSHRRPAVGCRRLSLVFLVPPMRRVARPAGERAAAATAAHAARSRGRGPPGHGRAPPRRRAAAQRLDESRLNARELLIDLELRRGHHRETLADLLDLVAEQPWRE